jgi:excisionase family DNA binding protein
MNTERPAEALLDVHAAAELLGVKPRTLQQWVWQGKVPYVRLGPRMTRFRPEALREWVLAREAQPQEGTAPHA